MDGGSEKERERAMWKCEGTWCLLLDIRYLFGTGKFHNCIQDYNGRTEQTALITAFNTPDHYMCNIRATLFTSLLTFHVA